MQTDGWLVQNVEDAAQIRAELGSQSNALRFAAAQCFGGTPEREITEPNIFHEEQALPDFRNEIGGDGLVRTSKLQLVDLTRGFACRKIRELIDRLALDTNVSRDRVQARTMTLRALVRFGRIDPFRLSLGRQFVLQNGVAVVLFASLKLPVPDFAEPSAFLARAVGRIE